MYFRRWRRNDVRGVLVQGKADQLHFFTGRKNESSIVYVLIGGCVQLSSSRLADELPGQRAEKYIRNVVNKGRGKISRSAEPRIFFFPRLERRLFQTLLVKSLINYRWQMRFSYILFNYHDYPGGCCQSMLVTTRDAHELLFVLRELSERSLKIEERKEYGISK